MRDPRLQKLAEVVVGYSVAVRNDQLVRITAPTLAEPLVAEIYRRVLDAGGHPFVRLLADPLQEILLKQGSPAQLSFVNPVTRYEVEKIDCSITVLAETNTRALTNCDPERMRLAQAARKPIRDLFLSRAAQGTLKWTATLYPTPASAQDAEMSLAEYEDFVFNAGMLHLPDPVAAWQQISQRQQRLVDFLNSASELRIVARNGTDIRMSVAGRTWINCDGHENFPDGEVFTGPILDSVQGQVRFSFPAVHGGREVSDVQLTFRDGRVVDAHAAKGQEFLLKMLDTDAGSRFLGECALGTNYSIRKFTRNTLFDEKIGGTVHLALGAAYPETGSQNQSGLHWDMVLDLRPGGFVQVDGQIINLDGRFTREDFPT